MPSVTGDGTAFASVWVGIDGFGTPTVEQLGTESHLVNGQAQYYAWYEMYSTGAGQPEQPISSMTILPGDTVSASVQYISSGIHAGQFQLSITDTSRANDAYVTYQTASQTQNPLPSRSTAEWIVEAPASSLGNTLFLANFGSVTFTNASATINGVTGPIDSTNWQAARINMAANGVTEATTLPLSDTQGTSSFTVIYAQHATPQAGPVQATAAATGALFHFGLPTTLLVANGTCIPPLSSSDLEGRNRFFEMLSQSVL